MTAPVHSQNEAFDVQAINDFTQVISTRASAHIVPSIWIDADRRGLGFRDLGATLAKVIARALAVSDLDEPARSGVRNDLQDIMSYWPLDGRGDDPVLLSVAKACIPDDLESSDLLMWLETIGALEREGFTLGWLGRRQSRDRVQIETGVNILVSARKAQTLPQLLSTLFPND